MKKSERNWINNPTKKQLILFTAIWVAGIFLLTIAITDMFRESFFQKRSLMIYILMIISTIATAKLHVNFRNNLKP